MCRVNQNHSDQAFDKTDCGGERVLTAFDADAVDIGIENVDRTLHRLVREVENLVEACIQGGVYGVKVRCSGRLGGAEIARADGYTVGNLPLQKLRANIDYGFAEAATTMGNIGIKVWLYKGDIGDAGAIEEN